MQGQRASDGAPAVRFLSYWLCFDAGRMGHEYRLGGTPGRVTPDLLRLSSLARKNISLNPSGKSLLKLRPSRPKEGRWPSSRTLGGMRWLFSRLTTYGVKADGEVVSA